MEVELPKKKLLNNYKTVEILAGRYLQRTSIEPAVHSGIVAIAKTTNFFHPSRYILDEPCNPPRMESTQPHLVTCPSALLPF